MSTKSDLVAITPDLIIVWLSDPPEGCHHDSRVELAEEQIRRWSEFLGKAMCDFSVAVPNKDLLNTTLVNKISVGQIIAEILCQRAHNLRNHVSYDEWIELFNKLCSEDRDLIVKNVRKYLEDIVGKDNIED